MPGQGLNLQGEFTGSRCHERYYEIRGWIPRVRQTVLLFNIKSSSKELREADNKVLHNEDSVQNACGCQVNLKM